MTKSSLKGIRSLFAFIFEKIGLPNKLLGQKVPYKIKAIMEEVLTVHATGSRKAATIPSAGVVYLQEIVDKPENRCDAILA